MNLKDLKIDLPKNWEEISRTLGENHIAIQLRHINPEINIAPELAKGYGG